MKKILLIFGFLIIGFALSACANSSSQNTKADVLPQPPPTQQTKQIERIVVTINGQQIVVRLYDNQAAKDLVAMLPLSLSFRDYAAAEKIAYLPSKLRTQGGDGNSYSEGDFAYFAPWGNLAVFYKDQGTAGGGLVILGRIESGKELLQSLNADFTATIERVGTR